MPSAVLKRAREPPLSLGWTLGQGLVVLKKKVAPTFPFTPRDEVLGEESPDSVTVYRIISCLAIAVTVILFLSGLTCGFW